MENNLETRPAMFIARPVLFDALLTLSGLWCGYMLYWLFGCVMQTTNSGLVKAVLASGVPGWMAGMQELCLYIAGFLVWISIGMGLARILAWVWCSCNGYRLERRVRHVSRNPWFIACLCWAGLSVGLMATCTILCSGSILAMTGADSQGIVAVLAGFFGILSAMAGVVLTGIIVVLDLVCVLLFRGFLLWYFDLKDGYLVTCGI